MTSILDSSHPDLIAFIDGDSIDDSIVTDHAGNYDGTNYGVTQAQGLDGNAMVFDGSSHITTVPVSDSIYAIATLVYFPNEITKDTPATRIFDFDDGENDFQAYLAAGINTGYAADETLTIGDGSSSQYGRTYLKSNIPAGWNVIIINWDGSKYRIFLNGIEQTIYSGSNRGHADLFSTNVDLITIGMGNSGQNQHLTGKMEYARFFSNPITQQDIELISESMYPYEVSGSVDVDGLASPQNVVIYDPEKNEIIKKVGADAGGQYSVNVSTNSLVYVFSLPPSGYRPLIHGPITPAKRNFL